MEKLILVVLLLSGCATKTKPEPVPLPPVPPSSPEIPQSFKRSLPAAAKASIAPSGSNTNSPSYGTVGTFPVEDGRTGVYVQWNNWPDGVPYRIQRSTNLIDWIFYIDSDGDLARTLTVAQPGRAEFFKISPR